MEETVANLFVWSRNHPDTEAGQGNQQQEKNIVQQFY